jgi:polysaccharide export outer membrane protein
VSKVSAPALKVSSPALKVPTPTVSPEKDVVAAYHLKPGDSIVVFLRGIPGVPGGEQQLDDVIDENGEITLPYINTVQAGGKTTTQVEQTIRKAYLDQQIYKYITVNVVVPSRSFYVRGEVRGPGRFPLTSGVTILQAIAAAGGFTEFANPGKVEVVRGSEHFRVDVDELEKHPERDKQLEAGDLIIVGRHLF